MSRMFAQQQIIERIHRQSFAAPPPPSPPTPPPPPRPSREVRTIMETPGGTFINTYKDLDDFRRRVGGH
jgi:hypothetical protein